MSISLNLSQSASLLGSANTDPVSLLLGAKYGTADGASSTGGNPITALQQAEKGGPKEIERTAKQPEVKRDIAAFRKAVATAKNLDELLANPTARRVLLTANGLGDQVDSVALAKKALGSDPDSKTSLATKLTDKRWLAVAKTFDFNHKGLDVLKQEASLSTVASGYAEVTWRKSLDASTPGLSRALDFRAKAAGITSTLQILGNGVLRDVVTTALGLPKEIALQSLEAQEKAISSRLDITKFKDPKFTEQFTRRFLLAKAANPDTSAHPAGITSLFA